jgi:hypothetical protein
MRREPIMYRFPKGHNIFRIALCFTLLIFIMAAHPMSVFPKNAPSLDRSATVTISGKTTDAVLVSERHFMVTESTTILDARSKKIQLSDLAVPCEAKIEYRLRMDKDPVVLKITVKRLLKGATERWPLPGSES